MYQEKFVAVVKVGGKILRERDEFVDLPFGTEYSILLKNLSSTKACAKVSVDGKDVLDGKELVVLPNTEFLLDGFLKDMTIINRFKFIQKTKEIVNHRGDRIDDGIVRVEYRFEKIVEKHEVHHHDHYWWPYYGPYEHYDHHHHYHGTYHGTYYGSDVIGVKGLTSVTSVGSTIGGSESAYTCTTDNSSLIRSTSPSLSSHSVNINNINVNPLENEGITVKGSQVYEELQQAYVGELEEVSHVIILRLRGVKSSGVVVSKPVTVKTKLVCDVCGNFNKSENKYCSDCGTSLI